MVSQVIAIIPARGGSKRIPGKNLIEFNGRPMISWTIKAALEIQTFSKVIVSTDDIEIAEISKQFGAEVPFFRDRYADDYSSVSLATAHALSQAYAHFEIQFDTVVQLMPNCPLRTSLDISMALEAFEKNGRRSQISCSSFGWANPWWSSSLDDSGTPTSIFDDTLRSRSQDLSPLFCPTGAIWISDAENLIRSHSFYSEAHRYEPMPFFRAIDIDDEDDYQLALRLAPRHG